MRELMKLYKMPNMIQSQCPLIRAACYRKSADSTLTPSSVKIRFIDNPKLVTMSTGNKLHVTMHVFSGRPDPSWEVLDTDPTYNQIKRKLEDVPTSAMPYRLGYRGFSVTLVGPSLDENEAVLHVAAHEELETLLLDTALNLGEHVIEHARTVIKQQSEQAPSMSALRLADTASKTGSDDDKMTKGGELKKSTLPPFDSSKWNSKKHMKFNSCYNYANDIITDTFAQPGRGTQKACPPTPAGKDIQVAMASDGLKLVQSTDADDLPDFSWNLVALVFWPATTPGENWDYHIYRLDDNERFFSHKPGKTPVVNVDNSGQPIRDPRFCNRGPYTEFVGFLETLPDKVAIV